MTWNVSIQLVVQTCCWETFQTELSIVCLFFMNLFGCVWVDSSTPPHPQLSPNLWNLVVSNCGSKLWMCVNSRCSLESRFLISPRKLLSREETQRPAVPPHCQYRCSLTHPNRTVYSPIKTRYTRPEPPFVLHKQQRLKVIYRLLRAGSRFIAEAAFVMSVMHQQQKWNWDYWSSLQQWRDDCFLGTYSV